MVQTAGNKLHHTITYHAEKIGYFCGAGNLSVNMAIHELRKSFKRLRALLRFYEDNSESPAAGLYEDIRNFGKLLAPLRESAVNIDIFDNEVAGNVLLPERKIKIVRDMLIQKNKSLLEKGFWNNNLCNVMKDYFTGFDQMLTENAREQPSRIRIYREVSQSYLNSFTLHQQLPSDPHPEDLHSLRKKLKRLFYQLDFIRFVHPRYFKMKTDQLNKINDQLGNDHDLHVFQMEFADGNYDFDSGELFILNNQIEHLRELNQLKLYPRLKQFFTAVPGEFDQKLERFFKL